MIAAVAENGVIGKDNDLPWRLPDDLKRFKRLTMGYPMIMGRRMWDSLGGRPLPKRPHIILTRNPAWTCEHGQVAHSPEEALTLAADHCAEQVFIVGGEDIYRLFLPEADQLLLTHVHAKVEGDRFFPTVTPADWETIDDGSHEADDRHPFAFTYRTYSRKNK